MAAVPELSSLSDPLSQARITVLLVPVGDISRATWDKWTSQIHRFTELRLNDVPGTSGGNASKADKARFLPPSSPPPNTHVHLSFSTTPPGTHLLPLSLLQVSAFPLAVIGIADLSDTRTNHNQKIGQFQKVLDELLVNNTNGNVYPLARRCFGVEEDVSAFPLGSTPKAGNFPNRDPTTPQTSGSANSTPRSRVAESSQFEGVVEIDASEGMNSRLKAEPVDRNSKMYDRKGHEERMVVIPKDGNVEIVLGMLMADLIASVLTEFGEIATALETPAGTQTLNASLLPTLTMKPAPVSLGHQLPSSASGESISRPRSANYSHMSVMNTALPARTPSPAPSRPASVTGYSVPGPNPSSISTIHETDDRQSSRPQSVIGTSSFSADSLRGFGNTSGPSSAKPDIKTIGNSIKRSSTGFSLSTSVGRVIGGNKHNSPMEVVSTTSPVGGSSTSPFSTSSTSGRLKKVLGDLWLMSGRLHEAIPCYTESITSLKSHNDSLWHASACEGLAAATLLEAWETRAQEQGNTAILASPVLSSAHDYLTQAYTLYGKSTCPPESLFLHGAESGEGIMARLYTACALRHARVLLYMWSAGGFGAAALNSLVNRRMPKSYPPMDYAYRRRVFLKLTTMSKISRSMVTRIAAKAHGPWLRVLPESTKMETLVDLATFQRLLGLDRREIIFDREFTGLAIGTIISARSVRARETEANRARADSNASVVSRASVITTDSDTTQAGAISNAPHGGGFVAAKQADTEEGTGAIIAIISRILDVLGIDTRVQQDEPGYKQTPGFRYGWPELQVELVREAVTAAENLPDYTSIMQFAAAALRSMSSNLAPHSQLYLYQAYARSWSISQRRGIVVPSRQWWIPDGLLIEAEITPLASSKIPYEQSISHLATSDAKVDPFLYNPRAKTTAGGKIVFIQNEQIECIITLSNPFSFDLEFPDISLATTGIKVECPPLALALVADSFVKIPLIAVAKESGTLIVSGIRVRLPDGQEEIIPIPCLRSSLGKTQLAPIVDKIAAKSKSAGLESRPSVQRQLLNGERNQGQRNGISCQVIPSQPYMWIRSTNLNHGSLITMDGETSLIRMTVENTSAQVIDFLKLTFHDSLAEESEELLAEGSLSASQAYELENDISTRPVLSWDQSQQINIPPGSRQTLVVRYLGKLGCENATIKLDYGNLETARAAGSATFFSRRITLPIITTVQPTLLCRHLNVKSAYHSKSMVPPLEKNSISIEMPKTPVTPFGSQHRSTYHYERDSHEQLRLALSKAKDDKGYCILSLIFANPSDQALEVHLERLSMQDVGKATIEPLIVRQLVAPKATERVVLPVAKWLLTEDEVTRPIPRSQTRQFVISKHVMDTGTHASPVGYFWYRERLLSSFRAWWTLPGSNRSGAMSFRHLRLSTESVQTFKQDLLTVRVKIPSGESSGTVRSNIASEINVCVVCQSDNARCTYKIQACPIADKRRDEVSKLSPDMDALARCFIADGETDGEALLANGSNEFTIQATFLAKGQYRIYADVTTNAGATGPQLYRGETTIEVD